MPDRPWTRCADEMPRVGAVVEVKERDGREHPFAFNDGGPIFWWGTTRDRMFGVCIATHWRYPEDER
jgi:hypothetical protein